MRAWLLKRVHSHYLQVIGYIRRSQWPRGLRRRCAAARLLRSWVRIPPGAWMFVCCECCVLLGRGLCEGLITRPEESYRLRCVVVCDLENLMNEEAMTRVGSQCHRGGKKKLYSADSMLLQVRHNSGHPVWWPFPDLSPRTCMFVILWPLFVHAFVLWLRRRRGARAQLL